MPQVRIWPAPKECGGTTRESVYMLEHPGLVFALETDNNVLATACEDTVVRTYSISTGELTRAFKAHTSPVVSVAICGTVMMSGSLDRTVCVWSLVDKDSTACVAKLEGHKGDVTGVALSPTGSLAATLSAGEEGQLIVWKPHEASPTR